MSKLSETIERVLKNGTMSAGQIRRSPEVSLLRLSESGVRNAINRLVKQSRLKQVSPPAAKDGDTRQAQTGYALAAPKSNGPAKAKQVRAKPVTRSDIEIHHKGSIIVISQDPITGEQTIRVR